MPEQRVSYEDRHWHEDQHLELACLMPRQACLSHVVSYLPWHRNTRMRYISGAQNQNEWLVVTGTSTKK